MHTTQVVSYSSIEHDGLGRYGDALNPRGDLDEMRRLAALLNPSGLCPAHPPPRTPPTAGAPRADRRGGRGRQGCCCLGCLSEETLSSSTPTASTARAASPSSYASGTHLAPAPPRPPRTRPPAARRPSPAARWLTWRMSAQTRGWDLLGVYGSGRTLEELARLPTGDGGRGDCDPNPATRNWEQPILVLRPKP